MRFRRPSAGTVLGTLALIAATGGVAVAAIPGSDGTIQACYGDSNGNVRIVDTPGDCKNHETAIAFNQTGPKGLQGDKGDTGAQGVKGDTGAQGAKGDTGAQGLKGDTGAQGLKGDTGAQGLKGDTGAQGLKGDTGDTGPAGPQQAATGFVLGDGSVSAISGPAPTVTRNGPGSYTFSIDVAGACFVPSFGPWGGNFTISGNGGGCANGEVSTIVSTGDGQDHIFTYLAVPTVAQQSATVKSLSLGAQRRANGQFPSGD
jgi:hypothetical protein